MKIKKMTLINFRCFKNKQFIEFDDDGKITLIYGLSGSGKTTLLQFISWVLYGEFTSSANDNKPLFNEHIAEETSVGDSFSVLGSIEFTHDNKEYEIIREIVYKKTIRNILEESHTCILQYLNEQNSWVEFKENIDTKINEIVPKALSKYFFFHGEKDLGFERRNSELKTAIYSMFDLEKYEKALFHLGDKAKSQTVIFKYAKLRNSSKPKEVQDKATTYFNEMAKYKDAEDHYKDLYEKSKKNIEILDGKIEELILKIGSAMNSSELKDKLTQNNKYIEGYERNIIRLKKDVGKILYQTIPYLVLAEKAKFTRNKLELYANQEKNFKGLKKELLIDILEQNDECICGRKLDGAAIDHIKNLINSMPPNSYRYTFNEFVKNAKTSMSNSLSKYEQISDVIKEISEYRKNIFDIQNENKEIIATLKSFEHTKQFADKLEEFKEERDKTSIKSGEYKTKYIAANKQFVYYTDLYNKALESEEKYNEYDKKVDLLLEVKDYIETTFNKNINRTIETLEESIKNVYKELSTRIENLTDKKFLENDFSLRKEYKTGGQEVIDVYSYVIGMIKALQKMDMHQNSKEFPVIVDAPFSKTDHLQLAHVIDVLPKVAPQVAFFTFDLDRIKLHADTSNIGNVWILKYNEDQTISTIDRGEI